ncbi:MAG: A24 family peptidase [Gammaproteobacteria bacterium]|nr:A24 family peptidase [Gammaproteobacteria bacterium]NNC76813.1 prepilin peptidase [Woeseiaceae bacterium]
MIQLFADSPVLFIASAAAFALLIGSFLNVVIYRLPLMMEREWREQCVEIEKMPKSDIPAGRFNLVTPRSRCPSCGKPILSWQNIPVLSYLALGGRCAACRKPISSRYPLVEAATAILVSLVAWRFGFGWEALMGIVLTLMLIPITMIDFDHQLIPDSIVLPLLWIGLGMSLFHPVAGSDVLFISSRDAIIGAIAGYLTLWSFFWAFKLATGKDGMGYGDFKLLGALGAWLGYQYLFTIVMMSAVVGAILGIGLIVFRGRDHQVPMPFGPFLATAGYIAMMFGDRLKSALNLPF